MSQGHGPFIAEVLDFVFSLSANVEEKSIAISKKNCQIKGVPYSPYLYFVFEGISYPKMNVRNSARVINNYLPLDASLYSEMNELTHHTLDQFDYHIVKNYLSDIALNVTRTIDISRFLPDVIIEHLTQNYPEYLTNFNSSFASMLIDERVEEIKSHNIEAETIIKHSLTERMLLQR